MNSDERTLEMNAECQRVLIDNEQDMYSDERTLEMNTQCQRFLIDNEQDIQHHSSLHEILRCRTFAGMKIRYFHEREKIRCGLRVVRGVDWEKDDVSDGGEGNVGTVVQILHDSEQVRVQWDCQDTLNIEENQKDFTYRTGMNSKYDLRLFDNAQTGALHKFACGNCHEEQIRGMRWHCSYCHNYDLCTDCYMRDVHNLDHAFKRCHATNMKCVNVGVRKDSCELQARGIFPDCGIKSRKDPRLIGTVKNVSDEIKTLYNCDAIVTWEVEGLTTQRRVGREGQVDIKCIKAAEVNYCQDHLEIINKANAVKGIRVVRKSPEKKATVGTIINVKGEKEFKETQQRAGKRKSAEKPESIRLTEKRVCQEEENPEQHCSVTVQWDTGETDKNVETSTEELLLFDNSQIGIAHDSVCKECNAKIYGIRWDCQCGNFNLCTRCYMTAKDDHVNHIFQRITEPGKESISVSVRKETEEKQAEGIFKGAEVQELNSTTEMTGIVELMTQYHLNNARCIVVPDKDEMTEGPCTDFQSNSNKSDFYYYPSHLPDLGKDTQGYLLIDDKTSHKEITVELWYQKGLPSLSGVKHSLYLIFAYKPDDANGNGSRQIEDVMKFACKSYLPCQLAVQKVLFVDEMVIVHKDTTNVTIQERNVKLKKKDEEAISWIFYLRTTKQRDKKVCASLGFGNENAYRKRSEYVHLCNNGCLSHSICNKLSLDLLYAIIS